MKCASCGFPLSPSRTSCPRCGIAVSGGQTHNASNTAPASWAQQSAPFAGYTQQPEAGTQPMYGESQQVQQPNWNTPQAATAQLGTTPPYPLPTNAGNYGVNPQPLVIHNTPTMPPMYEPATPGSFQQSSALPQPPQFPQRTKKRRIRFGFTVATLCVVTGGLLLMFVYILSGPLSSAANNPAQTVTSIRNTPVVIPSPTSTPAPPTPTSLPGAQYISNVQMASTINMQTVQPITLATAFKVRQKIYVTFDTHPDGRNGGVCLMWYLNNKSLSGTSYAFSVGSIPSTAYSFTTMLAPGFAYVEIYWSLLSSCSDPNKVLAQRTNFTVTA